MAVSRLSAGERKQAIVEAAIRLFSEKGFHGVTTRELAQAVGVSEPVLYQHFGTKGELYAAIIEYKSGQVEKKVYATCCLAELQGDDREILRSIAFDIMRWYEDDPTLSRLLLFSALEGQEFSDMFFARHASLFFDTLRRYFEHRIQQKVFRDLDSATCAWAFIGMFAHHSMTVKLYHFDPYPQPRERLLAQMVDLFLQGLQAQRISNET